MISLRFNLPYSESYLMLRSIVTHTGPTGKKMGLVTNERIEVKRLEAHCTREKLVRQQDCQEEGKHEIGSGS
jgi:hypothetical protein